MKIKRVTTGMIEENCYVYYDENYKEAVVIDPGNLNDEVYEFLVENNLKLIYILLTHGHYDHINGVESLKAKTGVDVISHKDEKPVLNDPNINHSNFQEKKLSIEADIYIENGYIVEFGNTKLEVIHTPGHTPGGVCYYDKVEGVIFTGDNLFKNTIGRTDLPLSVPADLPKYLKERVLVLPDATVAYCGHGLKTTIEFEKAYNPHLK